LMDERLMYGVEENSFVAVSWRTTKGFN
jgi:hypothetical protein